jgi:hypothetical protein
VLELDPDTFRDGPAVPGFAADDRDELWGLEDGTDQWGFRARPATLAELVEGTVAEAQEDPLSWPPLIVAVPSWRCLPSWASDGPFPRLGRS